MLDYQINISGLLPLLDQKLCQGLLALTVSKSFFELFVNPLFHELRSVVFTSGTSDPARLLPFQSALRQKRAESQLSGVH